MRPLRIFNIGILFYILAFSGCNQHGVEEETPVPNPDDQGDPPGAPARVWQEKWLDHRLTLDRVYYNDDVAIYYDAGMERTVTWPNAFMTKVWKYVKEVYGNFGAENRLYIVFHSGTYSGGRTGNIFDEATGYRSLSDVTSADWKQMADWNIDAHVHEIGHVVEGSSKGVHGSPAFGVWKDSKWAEIFQYDVYKNLGMESDAQRLYDLYMGQSDDFPRAGTYWFRDWFYPVYNQYGENRVLNEFFTLLSKHFPKNGQAYARGMNIGEFVHFYSGAAGVNLKAQATKAFGWTPEMESQFIAARLEFAITYTD